MELIPPIAPDDTMAPISKSKDGIIHCLVSDDSAPRVRLFRQSVRSLRHIRTVQSEGNPNTDTIRSPTSPENVSPRTRHRLLRILRSNSFNGCGESQDTSSDGLPSIRSLARCSLPTAAKGNIPCFSMMMDENPFRSEQDEAQRGGDEDHSMISSMSPDSARLYLKSDNAGGAMHAYPPVEIFVQRQRIPTEEWQDSWIRGVGRSSTPEQSDDYFRKLDLMSNPSDSSRPPPIVTVVDMQIAPDPPPAPKHETLNDDVVVEINTHGPTEEMNWSPSTPFACPMVQSGLAVPPASTGTEPQRRKPPTPQNRAKTITSHMIRRPSSSPQKIRKPRIVQKARTSPPGATEDLAANDPLIIGLSRRRDPETAVSVFSFGSIVGESTMITPMSLGSFDSSSLSFYMTERRSPKKPQKNVSALPQTTLRLPVPNAEIRDDEGDHPMKVFEALHQREHHVRKKTPLQNDMEYYWRQTKRFWNTSERPVALLRNRSGCLT